MATGSSFKDLSLQFYRGDSTIGIIVRRTCQAIWDNLQPLFMPRPTEEVWLKSSQRYYELWNLPNCVGALDGKHIRVKRFPNSGSAYINYKGFFSIVLMAIADADGLFTAIDVGDFGRNSDGGVFRKSVIGRLLKNKGLQLPCDTTLKFGDEETLFPYYLVGDQAFPLTPYLMRPYPRKTLNDARRIFNYRLSRGRKSVECAFGMLTSKFRIFERPICCDDKCAESVVKAACVLHNFIKYREGKFSEKKDFPLCNSPAVNFTDNQHTQRGTRRLSRAAKLRDNLAKYFLHPDGAIPTQWAYINTD